MHYGTIKSVFRDKGFGFIETGHGPDIFFLLDTVDEGGLVGRVVPRQAVMFVPEKKLRDEDGVLLPSKGPRAERVVLIDRVPGDKMASSEAQQVKHHPKARQRKPSWRR